MLVCKGCPNIFEKRKRGGNLYCSRLCGKTFNMKKHIKLRSNNNENKRINRDKYYKLTYGISQEDKFKLLEQQNNKCKICKNTEENLKNWHVDHCHSTKQIRGILCSKCNQGLGLFKDDINLLQSAIRYLNENNI